MNQVKAEAQPRTEVLRFIDTFRSKAVDVSSKSYTVEVIGSASKIQAAIDILRSIGIKEIGDHPYRNHCHQPCG